MTQSAPTVPHTVPSRDETWVFFDGEIRRYADSRLGLMTHALHYGTGCFEGIRAYWVEEQQQLFAFRMPEHYERLRDSAKILLMDIPLSTEEMCAITTELLSRNGWRQDVYIRPLVYKSSEEIGVRLHGLKDGFLVFTAPFGAYVDIDSGIRCMVSSWRRIDDNAAPARSKCTGIYVNSALAKTEAMQNGFDEAIMLTHEGHVCEGSAENIFLVRDGKLITPPESDNILEGITRATLIHLATEEMGLEVVSRCIDRSELYIADEVFLCGTGAQVSPVIEIDRRRIGDGEPGPLTSRIQADYFDICKGRNPKYRDWLTAVY
jgi:branched-chain amino acid aminotransferase